MAGKKADGLDLEQQVWAATETIREAMLGLLQAGDVPPRVIVFAMARVTGETGTAAALSRIHEPGRRLGCFSIFAIGSSGDAREVQDHRR